MEVITGRKNWLESKKIDADEHMRNAEKGPKKLPVKVSKNKKERERERVNQKGETTGKIKKVWKVVERNTYKAVTINKCTDIERDYKQSTCIQMHRLRERIQQSTFIQIHRHRERLQAVHMYRKKQTDEPWFSGYGRILMFQKVVGSNPST